MAEVVCEQLVYTWHATTLHGSAGHGVVLRSAGWPGKLGLPGGEQSALTSGASPDAATQIFSMPAAGGTLFGRRTQLGVDGSGRPGNFLCHLVFDPSGTVGVLDALLVADSLLTELAADVRPTSDWAPLQVGLVDEFPRTLPSAEDSFVRAWDSLVASAPAMLVNTVGVSTDEDASFGAASALDASAVRARLGTLAPLASEAATLGGPDRWASWWRRVPWTPEEWAARLRLAVLFLRPASELSVAELVEVGQANARTAEPYARELVSRMATKDDPTAPPMKPEFAELVLANAVAAGAAGLAVAVASDAQLLEMVSGGDLTHLPMSALRRLTSGESLPPAAVLRTLLKQPDFWEAMRQAPAARRDELSAWLLRRGGFKAPDWYVPVLVRQGASEYERFFGKMDAASAYDRLFSLVGDAGATEVLMSSGDLDAWALALAKRGRRRPGPVDRLVRSFNEIAERTPGIDTLRLTTTHYQLRVKVLLITLLVLLVAAVGAAAWALWPR